MEKLGRYEILETLGTGSMGVVYKARDTLLYREIALKTIGTGPQVDPELRERFYREARACALLQHPNIVTVFDLGEAENMAYIVMELLQGDDMRQLIEQKRPIPTDAKVELMVQVCEALGHAHKHQVIHRDIKPSNIFVQMGNKPKVLDFGIARLPSSKLTLVGRVLGTPNYMAPEQILGQGCDSRSDLFSAAVVFFEFAAGVHPFRSSFIPSRIVDGKADRLRDFDPALPYPLEVALARALEREPDKRYQTGEQFAADLRAVLQDLRAAAHGSKTAPLAAAAPQLLRKAAVEPRPQAAEPGSGTDTDFGNPPPGQESSEWRVSEFLRLLHEFDNSAAQGDLKGAQKAFYHMKKLETRDPRFSTANTEYGNRLVDLEDRLQPAQPEPPREQPKPQPPAAAAPRVVPLSPPTSPTTPRVLQQQPLPQPPPSSRNMQRSPEAPLDQTLPVAPPPSRPPMAETAIFGAPARDQRPTQPEPRREMLNPPVQQPPPPPRWDPPPPSAAPQPPPSRWDTAPRQAAAPQPPPPSRPPQSMQPPMSRPPQPMQPPPQYQPTQPHMQQQHLQPPQMQQQPVKKPGAERIVIFVAIGFFVLLLLAGAGYWFFMKEAKPLPAVGTAEVTSASAAIYEGPSTASVVQKLTQGDRVNITHAPKNMHPAWVRVQYVNGKKVSSEGYARSQDLGNWSTFALLSLFRPDDSAGQVELAGYIKSLDRLAAETTEGKDQIWIEEAMESLNLARAVRSAGNRPDEWLDRAGRALDAIPDSSDVRAQRDELRNTLRSLR
jgi:serine/threonine-protein kinase